MPAVYRQRDLENGSPLKALLDIIAEQIKLVEDDIENLYENGSIETCDEWAVPYKGDQIGARILYPVSNATYSQRAWVANTIGYRRRKGTIAMLEQLARDITGWDAKAVEFFQHLITSQYLNHLRPSNISTPHLMDTKRLDRLSTPFNEIAHTLDVRSISRQRGYYNIPNIGIFFWRLQSLPINAAAFDHGDGKFSFNQLGYDEPLFNHVRSDKGSADIAEEINISGPIRMLAMDEFLSQYYYDNNHKEGQKSIQIRVDGAVRSINDIKVCNLARWIHRPPKEKVAVDPVLGRILFPTEVIPKSVQTRHYCGFSNKIGGGSYIRPKPSSDLTEMEESVVYKISKNTESTSTPDVIIHPTFHDAIKKWESEGKKSAVFEILDSEFYEESEFELDIPSKIQVVIRAEEEECPVVRLSSPVKIKGDKGSSVIFDGLLFDTVQKEEIDNNNLLNVLKGDLGSLTLRHCTLVPGRNKDTEYDSKFLFNWDNFPLITTDTARLKKFLFQNFEIGNWVNDSAIEFEWISDKMLKISNSAATTGPFLAISLSGQKATLEMYSGTSVTAVPETIYDFVVKEKTDGEKNIYNPKVSIMLTGDGTNENLIVSLESTICGRILLTQSEAKVKLINSIVDGKGGSSALKCYKSAMENSTIFGSVDLFILELASNIMFTNIVMAKRIQLGCVRFSYVPEGSRTPRRFHCQPEYFNATKSSLKNDDGDLPLNLLPRFTSMIYGDPGYAQLHKNIAYPIFEGGDNGSEIGVFNNLYQPQRIKNLKSSLDEYLRFGLEVGIFLVA